MVMAPPELSRSVFTDKGPIAKPPLTLLQGSVATFTTPDTLSITGGVFSASLIGQHVKISGSGKNDGDYLILDVPASNRLKVQASFSRPDSPATSWEVYSPRTGQIADHPSHVTVRVNGTPVVPETVRGLLGQIILPSDLASGDTVEVDYSWVRNPTVELTRMNSQEFKFNNWNRELGRNNGGTGHTYRYNNVLIEPATYRSSRTIQQGSGVTILSFNKVSLTSASLLNSFVGLRLSLQGPLGTEIYPITSILNTTDCQISGTLTGPYTAWTLLEQDYVVSASLDQPQHRELHYRAYERAYSALMNDPNLLVFNSPIHKIAYPPLERKVEARFISYSSTALPESYPVDPWDRIGSGTAIIQDNRLHLGNASSGVFPSGAPHFWRRTNDLTFPHAFALAWNMALESVGDYQGVWTGVAAGYSTDKRVLLVGYLEDAGVRKIGFLRKSGSPASLDAWVGGYTQAGLATEAPVEVDWSVKHSYRIFRSKDGIIKLYFDGEVVEALRVYEEELPYLEEVTAPFNELQQVFWGVLSRETQSNSVWDFVRYQILPLNPLQTAPSIFVNYEANQIPEEAARPWTPVGYHGTEAIKASEYLLLGSTSATDVTTEGAVGLIGGDFRGYVRPEPLLAVSSDVLLDVNFKGHTQTHGITPNALMAAIDDGDRLTQLSFLTGKAAPKLGYGGRSFPTQWSPTPWSQTGDATAQMIGRVLRITDTSQTNGLIYYVDDTAAPGMDDRVLYGTENYQMEFRCRVVSYTADSAGFCGVTADVYDGIRTLGVMLRESVGSRAVALHSDGNVLGSFLFEWADGLPHTYRVAKINQDVTLYVDNEFLGTLPYTDFTIPSGSTLTGVLSFGSATPLSVQSASTVEWDYVNSWRVWPNPNLYVGLWKGRDPDSLVGYHLPLKTHLSNVSVVSNVVSLPVPLPSVVVDGDLLLIDDGPNKGVYEILHVTSNALTLDRPLPLQPSVESFRIPSTTNWHEFHRYRVARTPAGSVAVLLDVEPEPLIEVGYNNADLPSSLVGLPRIISGGLPSIVWGAFDPTNLSSSFWDYVRYGVTRAPNELRIVPHHQFFNQRNVIASPEHLRTNLPHQHTNFWSSSTGIPPQTDPDFLTNPSLLAYTQLNEGTPLVPRTQTSEVRRPTPYREFISAFNRIEDVMNRDGDFTFNDSRNRWKLLVPPDVLYTDLRVIEQTTGEKRLLAPFTDSTEHYAVEWQKKVCLVYDGSTLPEESANQPTPWVMASDDPSRVVLSNYAGHLNYSTDSVGTRTIYRNDTPLPDSPSLTTKVTFRVRVAQDGTYGLGDSQVRLGFSGLGMTLALAFRTLPSNQRYVAVLDMNTKAVLGGIPFDYLDGNFHTYEIVRDPGHKTVTVTVVN